MGTTWFGPNPNPHGLIRLKVKFGLLFVCCKSEMAFSGLSQTWVWIMKPAEFGTLIIYGGFPKFLGSHVVPTPTDTPQKAIIY